MTFSSLEEVDRYLTSFCAEQHVGEGECFRVRLVIEELVTNMFKYTEARTFTLRIAIHGQIEIELAYPSDKFALHIERPEQKRVSQREEGGLGLFLIESMTASFSYRHQAGKSIYALTI